MATLYYKGYGNWDTLANWYQDSNHTVPASSLPTSSDSVVVTGTIPGDPSNIPTFVNVFVQYDPDLSIPGGARHFNATGLVTFGTYTQTGDFTGDFLWTETSGDFLVGTIIGNGTVTGGIIYLSNGTILGSLTFSGNASFQSFSFTDSITVPVGGSCVFNNNSVNRGTIYGKCVFNDSSYDRGVVIGNVAGDVVYNGFTGTNSFGTFLKGKKQFFYNAAVNTNWATLGNWWMAYNANTDTFSIPATVLPGFIDDVVITGGVLSNSGSVPTVMNLTTNDRGGTVEPTFFNISIIVNGLATFSHNRIQPGDSGTSATITGNVLVKNSESNINIDGDAEFRAENGWATSNWGTVNGKCLFIAEVETITYLTFVRNYGTVNGECEFVGINNNINQSNLLWNSFGAINDFGIINVPIGKVCKFRGAGAGNGNIVNGNAVFSDNAANGVFGEYSQVQGNATFLNGGRNFIIVLQPNHPHQIRWGIVTGTVTYDLASATAMIAETCTGETSINIAYEKGINGSSILGVI